MIEFFFWGALIFGQALYWSFFRDQTEVVSDEYWKAHSLRFRNHESGISPNQLVIANE
jgi:hypothetical protein